jgi:hypothetical protein
MKWIVDIGIVETNREGTSGPGIRERHRARVRLLILIEDEDREIVGRAFASGSDDAALVQPSRKDYLRTMRARSRSHWEAGVLADAMTDAGFRVNYEAARTHMYRMERRGEVVKAGRGTWKWPDRSPLSATAEGG